MQLFKLITIDGKEENLPKESGEYDVKFKSGRTDSRIFDPKKYSNRSSWIRRAHSYYSPVEVVEKEVYIHDGGKDFACRNTLRKTTLTAIKKD